MHRPRPCHMGQVRDWPRGHAPRAVRRDSYSNMLFICCCRAPRERALANPVAVHRTRARHARERWMHMRGEDKPAAIGGRAGRVEAIKRMDRLAWRFSTDEIERLVEWQIRHQTQPDRLDVSVTISRVRFARWLFEHGRIGEDMDADPEASSGQPSSEWPAQGTRAVSPKYMPPRSWDSQFRQVRPRREQGGRGYPPPLFMMSRVRARLARIFSAFHGPERRGRRTGGGEFEGDRRNVRSQVDTWRLWSGLF